MDQELFKQNRFLLYDGAMGTMLQQYGLKPGQSPDLMNLTHPEVVEAIHRSYVDAGSNLICTNTFGANRRNLSRLGYEVSDVISAAVSIAKRAAAGRALVALDLGPLGELIAPLGSLAFEEAYDMFREMAVAGEKAGADLVAIETMADLAEMRAALLAVREHTSLPVLATMTFERSGRTYLGTQPESFAMVAEGLGANAVGVNCSVGPAALVPIVERMARVTSLPLIAKPNAGLPDHETGIYDLTPEAFASEMQAFEKTGVHIVGGCCGTNPDFIRALRQAFSGKKPVRPAIPTATFVCSASAFVQLDADLMVGTSLLDERREAFEAAVAQEDFDEALELVNDELDDGAELIALPVDFPQDQQASLRSILRELQGFVTAPLALYGSDPACLENALRVCQGKACVLLGEDAEFDACAAVAQHYGAALGFSGESALSV